MMGKDAAYVKTSHAKKKPEKSKAKNTRKPKEETTKRTHAIYIDYRYMPIKRLQPIFLFIPY